MAYDYKGAIHLHSTYSDGLGGIEEIMQAANEAGLDFVILTDHDTQKAARDGHERWHGSTLLIVATEITPDYNHYLAYGLPADAPLEKLNEKSPQEIIDTVNKLGGFGSIAHPDHTGTARYGVRSYEWRDWNVKGFQAMGIWDLMTDWQEVVEGWKGGLEVYDEFAKHLRGPKDVTLKRWDSINATARIFGVGEIDNHAKKREHEGRELIVFPYAEAFRTVTNHILLDGTMPKDYAKARAAVLDALRRGRYYVSLDYFDDPAGFSFEASDGDRTVPMGGELVPTEDCELFFELPDPAHVKIICDGEVLMEEENATDKLIEIEQPGVYRIEAHKNGTAWILSNPIFVRGE